MHPAYGYMDPYHEASPRPRDHVPHPDHHYPSWEAVPPHISSRPPYVGPWASNSSFSHSIPTDHNHCCSHNYPPGYYSLRPPHSPVQPPPQYYYHGPYPPYPPYPDFSPSYFVPPPQYSADQYRYDYDKPIGHCCGCPNHVCHPKDGRGSTLKIEEQKPEEEMEQKEGRLIRPHNSPPSPFFWVPHDSNKHKALDGGSELHPSSWNGWIPLDLNNLKGMMQGGNEKTAEEFPPKFKFIPLKFLENGSHEDKPGVVGDAQPENHLQLEGPGNGMAKAIPVLLDNGNKGQKPGGVAEAGIKKDQVRSKGELEKETKVEAKAKIIPVKEMEEVKMKPALQEKEMKQSELENNGGKKASGSKAGPAKKPSKLPPVCLRVDPLPKKKAVNGNSRSTTPVRKEERAHEGNEEQGPKDMKAREQKKDVKVIKVLDAGNDSSLKPEAVPVVPLKNTVGRVGAELAGKDEERKRDGEILGDLEVEKRSGVGQEELGEGKMSSENKEKEERKGSRSLSQSDAAVLIQSIYRGFEVRRWQPLEKLRKIGRIREQAADVERQIESLQASSKELDSKRRIVIGEAIMNLLLQLDAIQGLHSTIREIRKAVARYLTSLQEKLDSLGSQAAVDEPSQTEQDSTKKRSNDETVNSPSSTLETEQVPEKESAESLEQDGLTKGSSSELRIGTEHDDRKRAETESGNGEAVETPATALELPLPAFSDHEEQKEALVVNDENMESPCTPEESAQSSASRGENMTPIDVAHNLAVQELPELPELNCQESRTAEEICDGAMKDEETTIKVSDDVLDARSVLETAAEKEFDQKDEPLVHPSQLVSETGGVGEDAEEAAVEGEIFDAATEHESNAGVDQRKSLDSPLEGIKADETDCGDGIEVSAALSEGEDKPRSDIKEHPLLPVEKDETPAFSGVDNSEGLEVTLLEQIHPLQTMIENVSGDEDAANEGIEYIDAGAVVESSTKGTESPASNEVPEPSDIAAAFEADYSELEGEDASSAAYNVKTVCSKEKQLVEENEKLRQMVENLLEAGKHQLGVISELNGRVTDLEKKLSQKKKKVRVGRKKVDRISGKNTGSPAA